MTERIDDRALYDHPSDESGQTLVKEESWDQEYTSRDSASSAPDVNAAENADDASVAREDIPEDASAVPVTGRSVDESTELSVGTDDYSADNTAKEQRESVFQDGTGGGPAGFPEGVHKEVAVAAEQIPDDESVAAGEEIADPSKEGATTVGDMSDDDRAKVKRGRPFKKGQSGNPTGRPKGSRNRATVIVEQMWENEAAPLAKGMLDLATSGDVRALRFCLDRIIPPRRAEKIAFELPSIDSAEDIPAAVGVVASALANGTITIEHADAFNKLFTSLQRSVSNDVDARIEQIELQNDMDHGRMTGSRSSRGRRFRTKPA